MKSITMGWNDDDLSGYCGGFARSTRCLLVNVLQDQRNVRSCVLAKFIKHDSVFDVQIVIETAFFFVASKQFQ